MTMIGKLNDAEIEDVISSQVVGRIGCHHDGFTYVVPISYAYDGENIYGITREGMKLDIMRKNPKVCFEVEDMKSMSNWRTVISWGIFEEIVNTPRRDKALELLLNRVLPLDSSKTTHISPEWPFPPEKLSNIEGVVFRIFLTDKTGRFERESVTK